MSSSAIKKHERILYKFTSVYACKTATSILCEVRRYITARTILYICKQLYIFLCNLKADSLL